MSKVSTLTALTFWAGLAGCGALQQSVRQSGDPVECTRQCSKIPEQTLEGMRVCVDRCLGGEVAPAPQPLASSPFTSPETVAEETLTQGVTDQRTELEQPAQSRRLSSLEAQALFTVLEARFRELSLVRPEAVKFSDVKRALEARPDLLYSLNEMEKTGGQPDVIAVEGNTFVFADTSAESPEGRRDLNYDEAKAMADEMGVQMMDAATYFELKKKVWPDVKILLWLLTDAVMSASGFALIDASKDVYLDLDVFEFWDVGRRRRDGFRGLLRVPRS